MDALLESIRAALAADATADAKAAGAAACRTILTALDATATAPIPTSPSINPTAVANIVGALRGVPPDQLLDLAIAKLRSALLSPEPSSPRSRR